MGCLALGHPHKQGAIEETPGEAPDQEHHAAIIEAASDEAHVPGDAADNWAEAIVADAPGHAADDEAPEAIMTVADAMAMLRPWRTWSGEGRGRTPGATHCAGMETETSECDGYLNSYSWMITVARLCRTRKV